MGTGHDAMDVRMMMEILAPGMKHGDEPNLGAEVGGIGRDSSQRLGRRFEQDRIDRRFVLESDLRHRRRQREHDMEVRHRQQFGLSCGKPLRPSSTLALRAMPITAGIIGAAHQPAI